MITAAVLAFAILVMAWLLAPGDRPEATPAMLPDEVIPEAA